MAGLTDAVSWTTKSEIPSFGKGGPGVPQSLCVLAWLSQNKASGSWPSGLEPATRTREPISSHSMVRNFGPSYGHRKVPVAVEDPCVDEFVLRLLAVAPSILRNQFLVWERSLRVVVAPLHPARRRRCVEVPPTFLDILAVLALRVGEPKGPFLQDRVVPVPEG